MCTRQGVFELAQPLSVVIVGGTLALKQLSLDPRAADRLVESAEFGLKNRSVTTVRTDPSRLPCVCVDGKMQLAGSSPNRTCNWKGLFTAANFCTDRSTSSCRSRRCNRSSMTHRADMRLAVTQFDWDDPGVLEIMRQCGGCAGGSAPIIGQVDVESCVALH